MRTRLLMVLAGLVLAGCTPAAAMPIPTSIPDPAPSQTEVSTSTPMRTATSTWTPEPSLTPSPTPPARQGCASGLDSCVPDWPFPFQLPIRPPGNTVADPTYRYGGTQDGAREPHHGLDFPNSYGLPVYAAADGKVLVAGSDTETPVSPWKNFYGNVVVLSHQVPGLTEPVYTLYGHLSKVDVNKDQAVSAGQQIGEVGLSGVAVGSHLHFEVRVGHNDYGSSRNPALWLEPGPALTTSDSGVAAQGGVMAIRVARADGSLVNTLISVEYFEDPQGAATRSFPVEAYQTREKYPVNPDDVLGENFVLGNLPPGHYRVSLVYWGKLYERRVEVGAGRLIYIPFSLP